MIKYLIRNFFFWELVFLVMMDKYDVVSNFINGEINDLPKKLKRKITTDDDEKFNTRSEIKPLKSYVDGFIDGGKSNRFVVLPGLRGVGKTTMLYQLYDYLLKEKNVPSNQILYFSCEELNDIVECSVREITEIFLDNQHNTNLNLLDKKIFLLVDESQYDKNWALSGKIIFDKSDDVFMIFTGSSALDLEYNADAARRIRKKIITPLSYREHVRLNYDVDLMDLSDSLKRLLFNGDCGDAVECESRAWDVLINNWDYSSNDWDYYLRYGGFPFLFDDLDLYPLVDITKRVVSDDMVLLKNFTHQNQVNANRILRYIALQKPGEVSQSKLSSYLQTSALNVKNILDILEMTHLIFHVEPYSVSSKRISKSWKYYFATSSLKNALVSSIGNTNLSVSEFEGSLLENLVASSLFNLSLSDSGLDFSLYYDAKKKVNVDFLIQHVYESPIPVEVGKGKKDKRQIKNAMNRYNSDFGVVVSNKTSSIKQVGDVIFVPPKTFSFI